jgi:uncharacterized protein YbaP (TraB family)
MIGRTLKRIFAPLAGATLAFGAPAHAQQAVEAGGPALWMVADEDTTIYLFGTVHALPGDVEWLDERIVTAFDASDELVTEVDLGEPEGMAQELITTAMLPEGQTLRSLLTPEQTEIYEAALQQINVPAAMFDPFEPWYAGLIISTAPLFQQGYSQDSGVEFVLNRRAGTAKTKDELESTAYQLSLFDSLPMESQIKFMMDAAEDVDRIKPMLDAMVAEWLEGDADGLAALMNEGLTDPLMADQLLYERNRNWAKWIGNRMKAPGTVFVAVGAGHLAGEGCVQEELARIGIEATRIYE